MCESYFSLTPPRYLLVIHVVMMKLTFEDENKRAVGTVIENTSYSQSHVDSSSQVVRVCDHTRNGRQGPVDHVIRGWLTVRVHRVDVGVEYGIF